MAVKIGSGDDSKVCIVEGSEDQREEKQGERDQRDNGNSQKSRDVDPRIETYSEEVCEHGRGVV